MVDESVVVFWETYKDQFTWTLLPNAYLYDIYMHWINNQTYHALSKVKFKSNLLKILGPEWIDRSKEGSVGTGDRLNDNDAVAVQLDLDNWVHPFDVKTRYRGLIKKTSIKTKAPDKNTNENKVVIHADPSVQKALSIGFIAIDRLKESYTKTPEAFDSWIKNKINQKEE